MNNFFDIDEWMMREAYKEAQEAQRLDEVPVGAVIVHEGRIVAKAHNQVQQLKDPTAHAEMIAITQAANALQCKWLYGCTVYVTLEPCSMCAGALVLARCDRLVFGAADPKTGACGSCFNLVQETSLNHQMEVVSGIMADHCGALMRDFFQDKRQQHKSPDLPR